MRLNIKRISILSFFVLTVTLACVGNKEYGLMYPEHYDYLELKKVYTDEGYVTTNGQSDNCDYHYYRRDYLGNVREVWKPSGDSTLTVQRTRYYPNGLPKQTSQNEALQPYKYGGKEFVEGHGWDMYNSQARWYYPATMRTTSPDPLAEKYYDTSPYAWCGNNPMRYIDPLGMDYWSTNDPDEISRFFSALKDGGFGGSWQSFEDFDYTAGIMPRTHSSLAG